MQNIEVTKVIRSIEVELKVSSEVAKELPENISGNFSNVLKITKNHPALKNKIETLIMGENTGYDYINIKLVEEESTNGNKFNIKEGLPKDLVDIILKRIGVVSKVIFSFNDENGNVLYDANMLIDYSFTLSNQRNYDYSFEGDNMFNLGTNKINILKESYRKLYDKVYVISDIYDCKENGYYVLLMDDKNNLIVHNILNLDVILNKLVMVELTNNDFGIKLSTQQIKIIKGECK